jgi:hypothetical protein
MKRLTEGDGAVDRRRGRAGRARGFQAAKGEGLGGWVGGWGGRTRAESIAAIAAP